MPYSCKYCWKNDDVSPDDLDTLCDLVKHVEEAHPEEAGDTEGSEYVRETIEEAEVFIEETINELIGELESVENEEPPLARYRWSEHVDKAINELARVRWGMQMNIEREREAVEDLLKEGQ